MGKKTLKTGVSILLTGNHNSKACAGFSIIGHIPVVGVVGVEATDNIGPTVRQDVERGK